MGSTPLQVVLAVASANFELYQSIPTFGGNDAEYFVMNGNYFLVYANFFGNTSQV